MRERAAAWLAAHLRRPLSDLTRLGAGRDFAAFVVDGWVVRVPLVTRATGKLARERELLAFLAPRLPGLVPVPGQAVPGHAPLPAPLFAYPYIDGQPWPGRETSSPEPALLAQLAAFLASLHAQVGAPAEVDPSPPILESRIAQVVRDRHRGGIGTAEDRARVEAMLAAPPLPGVQAAVLQHTDLSGSNLLVSGGALAGVLDWSDSVISDPAIDYAGVATLTGAAGLDAVLELTDPPAREALRARACRLAALHAAAELALALTEGDVAAAAAARRTMVELAF